MRTTTSGAASAPVFGRLKPNCISASSIRTVVHRPADSLRRARDRARRKFTEQAELRWRRLRQACAAGLAAVVFAAVLRAAGFAAVLRAAGFAAVLRAVIFFAVLRAAGFAAVLRAAGFAAVLRAAGFAAVLRAAGFAAGLR